MDSTGKKIPSRLLFKSAGRYFCAGATGSENNDAFLDIRDGHAHKATNHAGGILGGISDGSDIVLRAAVKPTPSIFRQ